MTFMYQAALYCDDCGADIARKLLLEGKAPRPSAVEGPEAGGVYTLEFDDCDYDSNTFPKDCAGLSSESDSAQFCDAGEACLNRIQLDMHYSDGIRGVVSPAFVGVWLENDLTSAGLESVRDFLETPNKSPYQRALARYYLECYSDIDACPDCGRDKPLVRVSQSGDAIAANGACVPYGTEASEPQCLLVTPCQSCAGRDQTVMGSSWEDCDDLDAYTLVMGEADAVATDLEADGYEVELVD